MKNKKIFKQGLALLCAAVLLVGGFSIFATNSKAKTVAEQLAVDGYTRVTPETFGITEEKTFSSTGTQSGIFSPTGVTSFDKTYFDADVSFTNISEWSTNNRMQYLGQFIWVYMGKDYFRVYDYVNAKDLYNKVLTNTTLTNAGIASDEYFNIKIATDIATNETDATNIDVTINMWVNDAQILTNKTVTVASAKLLNNLKIQATYSSGTIKIRPPVVEEAETPDIPDTLEGYEAMTPATFGITEELVKTLEADGNIWDTHTASGITSFDNRYFEADISSTSIEGIDNRICYMGSEAFFIYVGWNELRIYNYNTGKLIYQNTLDSLKLTAGEYFHIKIATDLNTNATDSAKTDVTMKVWINENVLTPLSIEEHVISDTNSVTVTVDTTVLDNTLVVAMTKAGTIKIKEHSEESEPVDPNVPEGLEDYTKITPETFGITEEMTYTMAGSNVWKAYTASDITSFDKKYFEADVSFTSYNSINNAIRYMGDEMFFIYVGWNEFRIYSYKTSTLLYQKTLSSLDLTAGEYFNLKFATDVGTNATDSTKTDVTIKIWINNEVLAPLSAVSSTDNVTVTVATSALAQKLTVAMTGEGTIRIKEHVEEIVEPDEPTDDTVTTLSDITYELSSGAGYLLTGSGTLYVDDVETATGTVLQMPGDYVIKRVTSSGATYIQNISLYKVGDVNLGGGEEWTADDRADIERIIAGNLTSVAANKAADINNDGKVAKSDLTLMKKVINGELEKDAVIKKYHAPAVTYDFLGGDAVMPIGGYYGPYSAETVTDTIYKAIAASGVNMIVKSDMDYSSTDKQELIKQGLAYAEKYGIGVFVSDARLNTITMDENKLVTEHSYASSVTDLATLLGDYSTYESFLGNMIVDEPISDSGFGSFDATDYRRFKYYKDITTALNAYDNLTGYANLLGNYHMTDDITYEAYLREVGKSMNLLSFDSYPFFEKENVSGGLQNYLQSLGTVSKVAREDGYPFWSYVQAGTDFRDDGATGASATALTQAQTLWNVNTSLAFGAKGIVYFPLLQPTYYANLADGTYDYNRNGIIGANNEINNQYVDDNSNKYGYYTWVQTANKQIAAVDEVLMRAVNQGVIVTGNAATHAEGVDSIITGTDRLTAVSGDVDTDASAMVGCFTYGDTEAFYVVAYDYTATDNQTITLTFDAKHQYRLIQGGATTYGEGETCTITASAGEGVLVVLEDYVVHYEDISGFRAESGYAAPEAPAGYIFAGWFKDKACTAENAVTKGVTEGAAYAKFVDAKLLTVKAQITAGTTEASESTSIRFVTSVNDLNYRKVGFKVNIYKESGVSERDYCDNVVYKKLSVTVDNKTTDHTPQKLFCSTATFFKAQIINKIPNVNFDTKFEVTPYWETLDGTIVFGETAIKTVRQGIQ